MRGNATGAVARNGQKMCPVRLPACLLAESGVMMSRWSGLPGLRTLNLTGEKYLRDAAKSSAAAETRHMGGHTTLIRQPVSLAENCRIDAAGFASLNEDINC